MGGCLRSERERRGWEREEAEGEEERRTKRNLSVVE